MRGWWKASADNAALTRVVFMFPVHWFNITPMKACARYVGLIDPFFTAL